MTAEVGCPKRCAGSTPARRNNFRMLSVLGSMGAVNEKTFVAKAYGIALHQEC